MQPPPAQRWDPDAYASGARFVSELGRPLLALLDPEPGERILDLGCGDGALTEEIVALGCTVVGVDASEDQVLAARRRGIDARVCEATSIDFEGQFDGVLSNAVLHWIKDAGGVTRAVARALVPGGRYVAECGGAGCVEAIRSALYEGLAKRGIDAEMLDPWYFASADEYRGHLEHAGLEVRSIEVFDRPTVLPGDVAAWIRMFGQSFLAPLDEHAQTALLAEVTEKLRPALLRPDGSWTADYTRLRFVATKPVSSAGA